MSSRLVLYNAIIAALDTVTSVKTKGLWNNQFVNEANIKAFNYPAVFIHFVNMSWEPPMQKTLKSNQTQAQKGDFSIILHCGFSELDNATDSFATIDAILEEIHIAVGLIEGLYFTPLVREEEVQDIDHDRVIDWQILYTTKPTDCAQTSDLVDATQGGAVTIDVNIETLRAGVGILASDREDTSSGILKGTESTIEADEDTDTIMQLGES